MDNEPSYRNCPSPGLTFFKPCWAWVRFLERVSCEQCLAGVSLHYNNSSQFPYTAIKSVITSISWSETSLSQLKHMDTVRVKIGYPNNWMLDTKNWLRLSSPRSWILTHTHIWNCIPSSEHLTEAFPCHWTSVAMFLQPPVVGQGEQSSIFLKEICWVKKNFPARSFSTVSRDQYLWLSTKLGMNVHRSHLVWCSPRELMSLTMTSWFRMQSCETGQIWASDLAKVERSKITPPYVRCKTRDKLCV